MRVAAALLLAASLAACSSSSSSSTADASVSAPAVPPLAQEVKEGLPASPGTYPVSPNSLSRDAQGTYGFTWRNPTGAATWNQGRASLMKLAQGTEDTLEVPQSGDPTLRLKPDTPITLPDDDSSGRRPHADARHLERLDLLVVQEPLDRLVPVLDRRRHVDRLHQPGIEQHRHGRRHHAGLSQPAGRRARPGLGARRKLLAGRPDVERPDLDLALARRSHRPGRRSRRRYGGHVSLGRRQQHGPGRLPPRVRAVLRRQERIERRQQQ